MENLEDQFWNKNHHKIVRFWCPTQKLGVYIRCKTKKKRLKSKEKMNNLCSNKYFTFLLRWLIWGFLGITPNFEHQLRLYQQRFRKITTTAVLEKDENLFWSVLQWEWSCHGNEMMSTLFLLLLAVFIGTGSYKKTVNLKSLNFFKKRIEQL